ncbi:MAG: hypothetical protein P1P86_10805 [Bacteroidales bacterium]|nr:hypothetical protein [Bacteroidales bacterium]
MKTRILYFLSAAMFLFCTSGNLIAQSKEQIEKFNEERKAYFTEELKLTDKESNAFWPLYNDFQNRKMKLVEDERNTWTYAHKNADNLSDKEILETLRKVYNLKESRLELEREYYQGKFLDALPAKKVLKLGKVEWDFRRHLLHKLRDDGQGRRSQGGGSGNKGTDNEPFTMGSLPCPY